MGHATAEVDALAMIFLVAGVDAVAVALKDPFPIQGAFAEGLFEVFAAAAFLPSVADAASPARVIEHPDVSGTGFSGARGEFFDGSLIFASAHPLRAAFQAVFVAPLQ